MDIEINLGSTYKAKYDESLFDVYVIDYGDSYHYIKEGPMSELEKEARRIKGRYRDIASYNQALGVYYEYMESMYEKYGSKELFDAMYEQDIVTDYVPRKPRIKKNKELKFLKKNGIILGRQGRYLTDVGKLEDFIEDNEYYMPKDVDKIDVSFGKDKCADKIVQEEDSLKGIKRRSRSFESDAMFIDSWFLNKNKELNKGKKNKKKKKHNKKSKKNKQRYGMMITDLMKSNYEDYLGYEKSDNAQAIYSDGLLLSTGNSEEMEIYHKLADLGWDSHKIMKRAHFGKRFRNVFKAKKKKKKKNGRKTGYEDILIDIMTDNGYDDFEEFSRDMLDMTSANVFK